MSKAHRGKGTREIPGRGKGNCPVCKRTAVKTMYEVELNSNKYKVCKQCKAGIARGKLQEMVAAI